MPLPARKRHGKPPSSLPKDFLHKVGDLFKKQFRSQVGESVFLIYGDLYPDEVVFCVSLSHPKSLRAATLHISSELPGDAAEKPEKVTDQLKGMVDLAASWFSQGLAGGEGLDSVLAEMADAEPGWQEFPWEGHTLFVKLNRDNYALEKAADDFLRQAGFDPEDSEDEEEGGDGGMLQ